MTTRKIQIGLLIATLAVIGLGIANINADVGSWAENVPMNLVGFTTETVWEDLRFPSTRIRQGATAKPDFDTTDIGLLFPQNDDTEVAYINAQYPHAYKFTTDACPHVHFVQATSLLPTFKMDVRWIENGGDSTVSFATYSTEDAGALAYTSGSILQILDFPCVDGSAVDSLSSMMDIKLYRDDNVVSGDVLVKEFDIHYQLDSVGSRQEYTK